MARHYVPLFEEICTSEKLADLKSADARLLYVLLLPKCDRWGRMDARPRKVRALCWPLLGYDDASTAKHLADLERVGLVDVYLDGEGHPYLCVPDWDEKAGAIGKRDHRGVSQWPDPKESTRAKPGQTGPSRAGLGQAGPSQAEPGHDGPPPGQAGPCLAGARARDPIRSDPIRSEPSREEKREGSTPLAARTARGEQTPHPPNGLHQEAGQLWIDTVFELTGTHYPMAWDGVDGKQIKALLGKSDFSLRAMEDRARRILADTFWAEQGLDLKKFVSQWAALGNAGRVVSKPVKEAPALRALREVGEQQGGFPRVGT